MKFGGSSVGNSKRIKNIADIVKNHSDKEVVVVTSAMSGVTDKLVEFSSQVLKGIEEKEINRFIEKIKEKHHRALREIVSDNSKYFNTISNMADELKKMLIGVNYVGELTTRNKDFILSFGEKMAAPLVAAALKNKGLNSEWYTGNEAGIITDSNFGKAYPLFDESYQKINSNIGTKSGETIPVVTGFIAADSKNRVTTLGRGGSDYTASLLAAALGCDEIWIWTDVDGILTSDPSMVKNTKVIEKISYIEAMEMAFFGAKVVHPRAIEPAIGKGIPVRVKNSFKPEEKGSLIVRDEEKASEIIKAISIKKETVLITVSGVEMMGTPGVAARVFKSLADKGVNILMISQSSSETNISIVIDKEDKTEGLEALKDEFLGTDIVEDVHYDENVAIVAVIGAGMKGTKGIAARVFKAVSDSDVNILTIAQGSSEVNISFVINREDAYKAANSLHKKFIS